ncbi:hypothetical protein D3C76_1049440 [compost metagenome]
MQFVALELAVALSLMQLQARRALVQSDPQLFKVLFVLLQLLAQFADLAVAVVQQRVQPLIVQLWVLPTPGADARLQFVQQLLLRL